MRGGKERGEAPPGAERRAGSGTPGRAGSARGSGRAGRRAEGRGAKEPEARAAAAAGAPAQAPAEMWEPRLGGGVAMTTEGRGFSLKASPPP